MFGLVSRRRLEEVQDEIFILQRSYDYWKDRYRNAARLYSEQRRDNVRLRRELDALRNHVPLFGDVFNGKVL